MKKPLLLALALSAASFAASAGELSYTNIEFGYAQHKLDTNSYDGVADVSLQDTRPKGYYVRGSVELGESPFYAFGSYTAGKDSTTAHADNQRYRLDAKDKQFQVGLGFHYAIGSNTNLIAEGSYLKSSLKYNHLKVQKSRDGNGMRMGFGVDSMLTDNLEGWAKVNYTFGQRLKGRAGAELGMQYRFTDTWGIVGEANLTKGNTGYMVGVRASF